MKANKFLTLILSFVAILAITSCVEDDDFSIPASLGNEENDGLQQILTGLNDGTLTPITIGELKNQFVSEEATEIQSNVVVKGYVSSSDATGNFFREFYLQDDPTNPTAAIKVVLNQVDSYNQFNIGREVYIKLRHDEEGESNDYGLFIGEVRTNDDVITIGGVANSDNEVESISSNQISQVIFRSPVTETITPLDLKFSQISDVHIGMLVKVDNAFFPITLEGESYTEASDDFDTQRTMLSCDGFGFAEFLLETSSFADFKNEILPTGGGSITGIVSKTFNGSNLVLALNSVDDVDLNGLECIPLDRNDFSTVFEEDFNTAIDNTNLDLTGWTNFAETGSELWTEQVRNGVSYAEFSPFSTGDIINVGWLVSPAIDMDVQDNEILFFRVAQHHLDSNSPANTLEVFISTDYNGTDVLEATWESIAFNLPYESDSWYAFKDSILVDLSSYSGTLHVAFKVNGSGEDDTLDGAFLIDDFNVLIPN